MPIYFLIVEVTFKSQMIIHTCPLQPQNLLMAVGSHAVNSSLSVFLSFSHLIPEYIKMADQYVPVPGGPNNNNYANVELVVDIAKRIPVQVSRMGCPSLPIAGLML